MKTFITSMLFLFSIETIAQQSNFCGQYIMEQKLLQQHPEIKERREALEKHTADYTANYFSRLHQNQIQSDTILFVIPVVFHIMHNYGAENISKAQILDAMRIINEDFQKLNADTAQVVPLFQPIVGDVQVEFRLAQLDPQGNCTDGITRHQTLLTNDGNDALKAIVQWPPDKYLNIWVENSCSFAVAYAFLPGALPGVDGIVTIDESVGSIGTSNNSQGAVHTLSHEIGHYLNLWHTWGPGNNPGLPTNCNIDDFVFDTPNTIGSSGCNLSQSTCSVGVIDNVQNIMDYASCPSMFTQGQVARMQAALNSNISNRNNLWITANLLLTGTNDSFPTTVCAPVADFSDKIIRVCEGQSVTFYNTSYGGDFTTINWQFTGGNIVASTDTNPTVEYNTSGIYDVTLSVTNSAGNSTLTRNALVEVSPAIATTLAPSIQDFETLIFPSNNWSYENNGGTHWETTTLASLSGTKSIYLQNDSANSTTEDIFYTENFNLSNATAPVFNFKIAFANRGISNDNLKIFMSTDCGQTWVLKYTKSGNSLETVNSTALNFIPTASEWRQDAMNISTAAGQPNVRFKFQFTADGGNNIFIDDINISGVTGFEQLNADAINLSLSPNPANQQTVLSFELITSANVSYLLTDVTGREVFKSKPEKLADGKHYFIIEKVFSIGLYFLNLKIDEQHVIQKVVFK